MSEDSSVSHAELEVVDGLQAEDLGNLSYHTEMDQARVKQGEPAR